MSRMYEEDVPKARDESDEEDCGDITGGLEGSHGSSNGDKSGDTNGAGGDGSLGLNSSSTNKKKRWGRRNVPRPRRWVIQEEADFREKMKSFKRNKRQKRNMDVDADGKSKLSSTYVGMPESNSSNYVLFSARNPLNAIPNGQQQNTGASDLNGGSDLTLDVVPVRGFYTFTQPTKFETLSMGDAERMIENQRDNMTRYMMHSKISSGSNSAEPSPSQSRLPLRGPHGGIKKMSGSKSRLLGKLSSSGNAAANAEMDDNDDVMKDISFRNTKVRSANKARKELLQSLGEGLTVDDDGVLGGGNDAEFGGRRHFGRVAVADRDKDEVTAKEGKAAQAASTSAGNAMADDFYKRDVGAEYEDLDYDANEQFDDDDVHVGPADEGGDNGDSDGNNTDIESDNDDDGDDDSEEGGALAASLASKAGLKNMIAKSRGEQVDDPAAIALAAKLAAQAMAEEKRSKTAHDRDGNSGILGGSATLGLPGGVGSPSLNNVNKPAMAANGPKPPPKHVGEVMNGNKTGVELDKNGNRIISHKAVQREIWLHHGQIKMKRLVKIFDMKKKNQDQRKLFREIIKELCTLETTQEGNILMLKQHYANM